MLIFRVSCARDVVVGKLGAIAFARGFYAYVGSALAPAGFKRVTRHLDVSAGRVKTQKWHVDYLLAVAEVVATVEIVTCDRIECKIARELLQSPSLACVRGFGSSDCKCLSHLFYSRRLHDLENALRKLVCDCRPETFVCRLPNGADGDAARFVRLGSQTRF